MRRHHVLAPAIALAISAATFAVHAADWPHWRGPGASGIAPDATLPTEVERDRERRVEGAARRRRRLDADRQRRPRLRHVADRRGRPARGQPSTARPGQRRRDAGRARARRRTRRAPTPARRSSSSKRSLARTASGCGSAGSKPRATLTPVHDKHNLASPSPGDRRHARLRVVRHRPDRGARSERQRSSGSATSAKEIGPFDIQWGHGSSPVLYGDLLILLCDQPSRVVPRSRSTRRPARSAGRPIAARAGRPTARRSSSKAPFGARADRELDASGSMPTIRETGEVPLARRRAQPVPDSVAGRSTTA